VALLLEKDFPSVIFSISTLPMLSELQPYINWLTNRYVLAFSLATVWMLFFDQYDLRSQYQLHQKIKEMEEDKVYYQTQIKAMISEKELLLTDPDKLETFAREQYFMKKEEEDLFIIVEPSKKKVGILR
jgi:cell division protein FtsB